MSQHLVVEAMFAIKASGLGIILAKEIVGVDCGVVDAEESPARLLLLWCDILKLESLHLVKVLNDVASDAEGFLIVFSTVEKLMLPCVEHFAKFRHVECRIYANPLEITHLVSVHATHAGADNEVGLLLLAELLEERQAFRRVNGYVWSYYLYLWQHLAQQLYCAASS